MTTKRDGIPGIANYQGHRFEHYRSEIKMKDAKETKNMLVNAWKVGMPKESAIIRVWEVDGKTWYCVYSRRIK